MHADLEERTRGQIHEDILNQIGIHKRVLSGENKTMSRKFTNVTRAAMPHVGEILHAANRVFIWYSSLKRGSVTRCECLIYELAHTIYNLRNACLA